MLALRSNKELFQSNNNIYMGLSYKPVYMSREITQSSKNAQATLVMI